MKRIYALLFNLTLISSHGVAKASKVDDKYEANKSKNSTIASEKSLSHTIKSGDTISEIAKRYHTTDKMVRQANDIKSGENLKLGRVLKIPINTRTPIETLSKYTIKSGDSLSIIAQKNHTTTANVSRANGLKKGEILKLGRVLNIPTVTYVVEKKDEVSSVEKPLAAVSVDKTIVISKPVQEKEKKHITIADVLAQEKILAEEKKLAKVKADTLAKVEAEKILANKKKEEAEKLALVEKLEKEKKLAEEQRLANIKEDAIAKAEAQKLALQKKEEADKLALAEKLEKEKKLAEEQRLAKIKEDAIAKAEAQKLALQKKEESAKLAKSEKSEKTKMITIAEVVARAKAEEEKLLAEKKEEALKLANVQKEEALKLANAQKEEKQKVETLAKAQAEKVLAEKNKESIKLAQEKKIEDEAKQILLAEATVKAQAEKLKKEEEAKLALAQKEIEKKKKEQNTERSENAEMAEYSIVAGDTLFTIARKHHTTIEEVRKTNGLKKGEGLSLGRVLKVPMYTYYPENMIADYHIQNGDTLFKIARKHRTTTKEIRQVNGLEKGENLKLGRLLKVPTNTYSPDGTVGTTTVVVAKKSEERSRIASTERDDTPSKTHKVKKGETLSHIARKNNTTVAKIKKANGIRRDRDIKIGQILKMQVDKNTRVATVVVDNTNEERTRVASEKTNKIKERKKVVIGTESDFVKFMKSIGSSKSSNTKQGKFPNTAKKHLGKRYVWGASGPYNFDCSGFTSYVCKRNGVTLPRTSVNQSKVGKYVSMSNLKAGDLIFFDTSRRGKGQVNHVGIYIGNNKFIHASSAQKKVVVTSLDKSFYKSRFKWGRRVD